MEKNKLDFLENDFIPLVRKINASTEPIWGKMNAQQMVEHLIIVFKNSSGKIVFPLTTPIENVPAFQAFLQTEKPFRQNTKGPAQIFGEEPAPTEFSDLETATNELEKEVSDFILYFKNNPTKMLLQPVFGNLDFDGFVRLHYKHTVHHLAQFGVVV